MKPDTPTVILNTSKKLVIRPQACPFGTTEDNLKTAIAGETHEYTDMYPGMARNRT